MKKAIIAVVVVLLAILIGSVVVFRNEFRHLKAFAPDAFGMVVAGDELYVDPAMTAEQRIEVRALRQAAEARLHGVFPDLITAPPIIACATEDCFRSFGGERARAMSFGNYAILLSPRGLTLPILTHELSHAELYARLGGMNGLTLVPRWFDEGLAVMVSEEPTHSEAVWDGLEHQGIARPALGDLVGYGDWGRAVQAYGDGRPEGPKIVYATAGHEVRRWYSRAGADGLAKLITLLRADFRFDEAYTSGHND